jgi:hypothetical protein
MILTRIVSCNWAHKLGACHRPVTGRNCPDCQRVCLLWQLWSSSLSKSSQSRAKLGKPGCTVGAWGKKERKREKKWPCRFVPGINMQRQGPDRVIRIGRSRKQRKSFPRPYCRFHYDGERSEFA